MRSPCFPWACMVKSAVFAVILLGFAAGSLLGRIGESCGTTATGGCGTCVGCCGSGGTGNCVDTTTLCWGCVNWGTYCYCCPCLAGACNAPPYGTCSFSACGSVGGIEQCSNAPRNNSELAFRESGSFPSLLHDFNGDQ